MDNFMSIMQLDQNAILKLKKDPNIDNTKIYSKQGKKLLNELSSKNCEFTEIQKSILKLFLGVSDIKDHSIYSISKKLNIPVHQVRYLLNSACYSIKYSYKSYTYDSLQELYNYDLNYELLDISNDISALQYNVLILFFKYKVHPIDIEIYYLLPNINVLLLNLFNKHKNIFVKKETKKMLEFQPNFKRTRSNRFILQNINIKEFLKYFNSLDNISQEMENTLKEILAGKLLIKDLEKLPEFTKICKCIAKYNSLNIAKDSSLSNKNTSLDSSPDAIDNTNLSDTSAYDKENENDLASIQIINKLLYVLKHNIKIKKKDRKKLYKLWKNRYDNSENVNSILSILDSLIVKTE